MHSFIFFQLKQFLIFCNNIVIGKLYQIRNQLFQLIIFGVSIIRDNWDKIV